MNFLVSEWNFVHCFVCEWNLHTPFFQNGLLVRTPWYRVRLRLPLILRVVFYPPPLTVIVRNQVHTGLKIRLHIPPWYIQLPHKKLHAISVLRVKFHWLHVSGWNFSYVMVREREFNYIYSKIETSFAPFLQYAITRAPCSGSGIIRNVWFQGNTSGIS